jgi:hypothetical protein
MMARFPRPILLHVFVESASASAEFRRTASPAGCSAEETLL